MESEPTILPTLFSWGTTVGTPIDGLSPESNAVLTSSMFFVPRSLPYAA
jgi:hypothetical protein